MPGNVKAPRVGGVFVCPSFPGPSFAGPEAASNCTRSSRFTAPSQSFAITEALLHDVNVLALMPPPGSFIVMDRAYVDFARPHQLHLALTFFVIRARDNLSPYPL